MSQRDERLLDVGAERSDALVAGRIALGGFHGLLSDTVRLGVAKLGALEEAELG